MGTVLFLAVLTGMIVAKAAVLQIVNADPRMHPAAGTPIGS